MDENQRIKLIGHTDAPRIEEIIGACLVDVAYVDEITEAGLFVIADNPVWLTNDRDFVWLSGVISETLAQHGITGVRIELERSA